MRRIYISFIIFLLLISAQAASAESVSLDPSGQNTVVGEIRSIRAKHEDTLVDLARRFDVGHDALIKANRETNRWLPGEGTEVVIPSMYVLPDAPKDGLVLNLAELRLYYYPPVIQKSKLSDRPDTNVMVFPVSVGRMDWKTPLGRTTVVRKKEDPPWYPTKSVREEHAAEGEDLPKIIPGGSVDNPLGHFALYLKIPGYLIHGTDEKKSLGIGMRVTHGCVRMYPEDIKTVYDLVPVGTPVYLINQPVKAGLLNGGVYLEVHRPLEAEEQENEIEPEQAVEAVRRVIKNKVEVDFGLIREVIERGDGLPVKIGEEIDSGGRRTDLPPPRRNN